VETKKGKVICAMSGGVDSSVAAALLKKDGFEVIGVFMKFWSDKDDGNIKSENRCCSSDSEKRARSTAAKLKIPFYVFNFEKEFKKMIVDEFLSEHKKGMTPNPCVACNKEIKFGLLLEKGLKLKAKLLATGHYAIKKGDSLLKAKDANKDQSYFLWQLSQKQLEKIIFPVGNYTKDKIRKLAKKFDLPVFDTPDSQEVCFIPKEVKDFLKKHLSEKPGDIVDDKGKILARHNGLWFHTIGQRKGIGLPGGPYYVSGKDLKKNILIVTKNEKNLLKKEIVIKKINWISEKEPKLPLNVDIKIRYRDKGSQGRIEKVEKGKLKIVFKKSQRAVTSGQSAVMYKGKALLGGGIIC